MTDGALDTGSCAAAAAGLDPARMPRHVGVIMDGNGRWARQRGWERTKGHQRGAEVVRTVTTTSRRLGIERLTLYAFSSENWSRPRLEISVLMKLLEDFLVRERPTLMENGIRLEAIGRLDRLPKGPRRALDDTMAMTAGNDGMVLCLALSYGGRDELIDAVQTLAQAVASGQLAPEAIDDAAITAQLYAPHAPEVDVVIRTAGEQRLSNFLLWQAAYAEYVSVEPLWPDFDEAGYLDALRTYQARERRFGKV